MIRINLLPVKKAKKREAGQRQILYMGLAVMASLGGVIFVHIATTSERDEIRRKNMALQSEIDRFKAEMGDYDKIIAQRDELLKQRKSIDALKLGRTGPTYLLRELSEILTPGKGPTFDRVKYEETLRRDPNVGFKASWDTRRVWIESFEEDQKKLKIKGAAKSHEDVAEFLKRLQLSVFFADANLETTVSVPGPAGAVKHVTFTFGATVIY
jgi:type IV pilus assembly protein PilN